MRRIAYALVCLAGLTHCFADHASGDLLTPMGASNGSVSSPAPGIVGSPQPATSASPAVSPQPGMSPMPGASPGPSPGPKATGDLCARGFPVCDDFETAMPGQSPNANWWSVETTNPAESVTIDATRAYSGQQSLHIHTSNSGYERAVIINKSFFPAPSNMFYGRMFFYLAGSAPQTHFDLVTGSGTLPGQSTPTTVNYGGQIGMFLANYYNANNPSAVLDLWKHAGLNTNNVYTDVTAIPTDRWACLEWQFKGDTNEMHMWLDGNAVDRMTLIGTSPECCPTTTWTQPPFSQVTLGWTLVANSEPFDHFDYWLDAVTLSSQRIGCLP